MEFLYKDDKFNLLDRKSLKIDLNTQTQSKMIENKLDYC